MNPTNYPDDPDEISVIEELDPEDGHESGGRVRFDILLGIPLLLAVILFAGWQWWHQDYQSSQYRAGLDAAGRNDLDAALHYYSEASGYNDADRRAQNLRTQIGERDRLYKSAVENSEHEKWLNALSDIRAAAMIQPGYKDLPEREQESLDHALTDALKGTILQREGADPPGLYVRSASGWTWLERSDAGSSVIQISDGGDILYDVPIEESTGSTPTPRAGTSTQIRDLYDENRGIELAQPRGDGSQYTFHYMGNFLSEPSVAGKDGFWLFGPAEQTNDDTSNGVNKVVKSPSPYARLLLYQPYSGASGEITSIQATAAFSTGNTIVTVDPDSNHYLLAEWSGAGSSGSGQGPNVNLYLCTVGSGMQRLVLKVQDGGIQSAVFSPGGRYALVNTYRNIEHDGEPYLETVTTLIDLQEVNKTRTLSSMITQGNARSEPQQTLNTAFVRNGVFKGNVLLVNYVPDREGDQNSAGTANIRLIDAEKTMATAQGDTVENVASVSGIQASYWRIVEQDDSGLLIKTDGQYDSRTQTYGPTTLIRFDQEGHVETYTASGNDYWNIVAARTTGSRMSWSTIDFEKEGLLGPSTQSVYTMEIPDNDEGQVSPKTLYLGRDSNKQQGAVVDIHRVFNKVSLGERLIGYTLDGDLHVRAYDEDLDIVFETGVTAIWSSAIFNQVTTLR